jgi:adenylate cyclase, class 2
MIEIELKIPIENTQVPELLEKIISFEEFKVGERLYEKNVMYDNPAQLMINTDGRIRLRQTGDKVEFCYKKPLKDDSGIKKEIEHEVNTSNFDITHKILEMMEFTPMSSYERFRTKIKGMNTVITIDEYPFQTFVEIEGQVEDIKKVALLLGLDIKRNTHLPCDTLFVQWREKQGLPIKYNMTFADYDK